MKAALPTAAYLPLGSFMATDFSSVQVEVITIHAYHNALD